MASSLAPQAQNAPRTTTTDREPTQVAASTEPQRTQEKPPLLLLFSSRRSGQSRRVEGYVAHVMQRRHNHDSFRFCIVDEDERPDLFERLEVTEVPTLLVVDNRRVACKLGGYVRPQELEDALQPWLH